MARRSLQRMVSELLLSTVGVSLIIIALVIMLVREFPIEAGGVLLVGIATFAFWKHASAHRQEHRRAVARAVTDRQIDVHRQALLSYFRQSIRADLFGNEDTIVWQRHIDTFLETKVLPELKTAPVGSNHALVGHLAEYVDGAVRATNAEATLRSEASDVDVARLSPREYEQHCASILFRCGWTVHPTPVTGDHGADVVAERDGERLIVQCKLYGQPVGNKAVQEVYAACPLYNGTVACVVAPSGFTPQAQRAAHALSVRLLHHSELAAFTHELSAAPAPGRGPHRLN